jgi:uncharacterized protein YggE
MKMYIFTTLIFAFLCTQYVSAQNYDPRRTISVSGTAEVKVVPNEVVISMAVETNNMSLDKAREENDSKTSAVLSMARKYGIEEKFIQTSHMQVEPRFDNRYNTYETERKFLGYYVTKNITITLRDVSKFEKFIADALTLGTNYIHSTDFGTTDLRKYKDQARLDAIRAAKEKATALAGELGQKIGKPITITEGSVQPIYGYLRGTMTSNMIRDEGQGADGGGSVAPGEIKVEANVNVTFELE